jgi:hypothetical protein
VADGAIFEKRGVPAAAIVTSRFVRTAELMARRHGFSGYRYAQVPHPIGNLTPEQVRERAAAVLPDVLAILGLAPDGGDGTAALTPPTPLSHTREAAEPRGG